MNTVTVTHIATGETFEVKRYTSTPSNVRRVGLRMASVGSADAITGPCTVCGEATAATARTAPVVDTPYGRVTIPTGHADRVVNDHPAFRVTGGHVAYVPGVVFNVCARHNLRDKKKLSAEDLAILERVALAGLRKHH